MAGVKPLKPPRFDGNDRRLEQRSFICEKNNLFSSHIFIIQAYNNYPFYFLIKNLGYVCEKINKISWKHFIILAYNKWLLFFY